MYSLLAVQDHCETSRDRNGDTKAVCGFFYDPPILRCGMLLPHVRRIIPWHKGP
jgi:hypothetical protein